MPKIRHLGKNHNRLWQNCTCHIAEACYFHAHATVEFVQFLGSKLNQHGVWHGILCPLLEMLRPMICLETIWT